MIVGSHFCRERANEISCQLFGKSWTSARFALEDQKPDIGHYSRQVWLYGLVRTIVIAVRLIPDTGYNRIALEASEEPSRKGLRESIC